jgi:ribosomal protein S11
MTTTQQENTAPVAEGTPEVAAAPKKVKRTKHVVQAGQVHIDAHFNNTIVSVTDSKGNVLTWASG